MKLQSLRFKSYDKFGHPVFIASSSRPDESENYETLKGYAEKLVEKEYDTFLPIYSSEQFSYASIRFMKNIKHKNLIPDAKYDVEYKIRTINKNGRIFVNCTAERFKMVAKAPEIEIGEELEL